MGLVALSVLYLIEVDYTHITVYNWAAFAIIALTFIPLAVSIIIKARNRYKARQDEKLLKQAEKQQQEEERRK